MLVRAWRRAAFAWFFGAGVLAALALAAFGAAQGAMRAVALDLTAAAWLSLAFALGWWRRMSLVGAARLAVAGLAVIFAAAVPVEIQNRPQFLLWAPLVPIASVFFFGVREGLIWSAGFSALVLGTFAWHLPALGPKARAWIKAGMLAYPFIVAMGFGFAWVADRYERGLRRAAKRLIRHVRAEETAERMETMRRVAGGVAHEINNALAVVIGELEILKQSCHGCANASAVEAQAMLDAAAERMARMARLLEMYLGVKRLRPGPVALERVVQEALMGRRARGVVVAGAAHLEADARMMQVLVEELLDNALRASPRVRVALGRRKGWAFIRIADRGAGVPEAIQPKMFEPFVSGDASRVGLGLAAARTIARRHGGRIEVRTGPSFGTEITVWLPARPPEED